MKNRNKILGLVLYKLNVEYRAEFKKDRLYIIPLKNRTRIEDRIVDLIGNSIPNSEVELMWLTMQSYKPEVQKYRDYWIENYNFYK